MKKKILSIAVAVLLIAVIACMLVGCRSYEVFNGENDVSFSVNAEVIKDGKLETVADALNYLAKEGSMESTITGTKVVEVGGLKIDDGSNQYYKIYSDSNNYTSNSKRYNIDGIVYKETTKDVTELPVEADVTYVFVKYYPEETYSVTTGDNYVTFKVNQNVLSRGITKVKDAMDYLVIRDELTYSLSDTMLDTIKDLAQNPSTNTYLMIYSDSQNQEYVNDTWRTYELGGITYKSTTLGIIDLPVEADVTYVFVLTTF